MGSPNAGEWDNAGTVLFMPISVLATVLHAQYQVSYPIPGFYRVIFFRFLIFEECCLSRPRGNIRTKSLF